MFKTRQEQTPELCLAAVSQDGKSLQYIQRATVALCVAALTNSIGGLALDFVPPRLYTATIVELALYWQAGRPPSPPRRLLVRT
jgi:hypothetical protein